MDVTPELVATLRSRLNAGAAREPQLASALEVASHYLARHIGQATIPEALLTEQLLDVASRVFRLRASENGSLESTMLEGPALTISSDPLYAARIALAPYLGPGIA